MITLLITLAPVIGAFFMLAGICGFTYVYIKIKKTQLESPVISTIVDPKFEDEVITVK